MKISIQYMLFMIAAILTARLSQCTDTVEGRALFLGTVLVMAITSGTYYLIKAIEKKEKEN